MDTFYRRRLPHWHPEDAILFLTWRLAGSPPPKEPDILTSNPPPKPTPGPLHLQDPRIAEMILRTLHHGEQVKHYYDLYAWVIMPNHIHLLLKPNIEVASILRWLKGRTARVANQILGTTGQTFWQDESHDHWVRSALELESLTAYIEDNPLKANLVQHPAAWPWSSACEDQNKYHAPAPEHSHPPSLPT